MISEIPKKFLSSDLRTFSILILRLACLPSPSFHFQPQQLNHLNIMHAPKTINIVRLDGIHTPSLTFSPGLQHTYTEYLSTPSDIDTIVERIKDADVVITTRIPISAETLDRCPRLKHVAVLAIGMLNAPRFWPPILLLPHHLPLFFHFSPRTDLSQPILL